MQPPFSGSTPPPSPAATAGPAPGTAARHTPHHRRLHPPATHHGVLGWRNIYVLPTRAGWVLLGVLLVLLIASVNYQLSLGYLLTFLLAGSVAASVGLAHANLRGLQLHALPPAPVFAGQTVQLQLRLQAPPGRTRRAVLVALGERPSARDTTAWSGADVDGGRDALLDLGFAAPQRGHRTLPRVTVQTLFPLGAFRLWSHWQPAERAWVYPAPETPPPPWALPTTAGTGQDAQPAPHAMAEPDGVRAYQRGDPLRHIVWKKAAQALSTGSDQLVSRSRQTAATPDSLWLDEAATPLPQREARLSRLTAWALQAQQQHLAWGLRLQHGPTIAPALGAAHAQQCLQALAVYGLDETGTPTEPAPPTPPAPSPPAPRPSAPSLP